MPRITLDALTRAQTWSAIRQEEAIRAPLGYDSRQDVPSRKIHRHLGVHRPVHNPAHLPAQHVPER